MKYFRTKKSWNFTSLSVRVSVTWRQWSSNIITVELICALGRVVYHCRTPRCSDPCLQWPTLFSRAVTGRTCSYCVTDWRPAAPLSANAAAICRVHVPSCLSIDRTNFCIFYVCAANLHIRNVCLMRTQHFCTFRTPNTLLRISLLNQSV